MFELEDMPSSDLEFIELPDMPSQRRLLITISSLDLIELPDMPLSYPVHVAMLVP